jgi:DNA adenine methylase
MKPILKWVGGKTQIMEKLFLDFPNSMENYHEIFLGGGSVLFELLEQIKNNNITVSGQIYAYDSNEALINVYTNIQKTHLEVYNYLMEVVNTFRSCPTEIDKEKYYYNIRNIYNSVNKNDCYGSALFIFLNKTCFRGLHRVGPHGFNVPYGHPTNPEIINKNHLEQVSELIQNVIFECCDFSKSMNTHFNENDFIYLDPPYVPEKENSFTGYTKHGFEKDKHVLLFQFFKKCKGYIMMSNSNTELVKTTFKQYELTEIVAKRAINSKNPESKTMELIVKNYTTQWEMPKHFF